jgi:quinol monooxygenase YgiN
MNSREVQMIRKLMTTQITERDIQEFINLKKEMIQTIQSKPSETSYDLHVKNFCKESFNDKKNELIEQYKYFSNLYEYVKIQNLQDSKEILEIINNISNELLINL